MSRRAAIIKGLLILTKAALISFVGLMLADYFELPFFTTAGGA